MRSVFRSAEERKIRLGLMKRAARRPIGRDHLEKSGFVLECRHMRCRAVAVVGE
jgi:hypothetical protein